MSDADDPAVPLGVDQLGRVHLVGVGGAGMSGVARLLRARGVEVGGSDARDSPVLTQLDALGVRTHVGHDQAHLGELGAGDTLVVSSAVRDDNPELVAARARGLRVLHRSQALAALMVGTRSVAVAGTHGKTTTTSMLVVALQHSGFDPSFMIGGELASSGTGAHWGEGEVFVAEADESDASFLAYTPDVALVTNVEPDHLDHYGTAEAVSAAFAAFAARLVPGGLLVACADDPGSAALAAATGGRTYGTVARAHTRLVDVDTSGAGGVFTALVDGSRVGPVRLQVPGLHNVLDAGGALVVALHLGAAAAAAVAGLEGFTGARRRFESRGSAGGVRVVDDYAHHPTEVRAVLTAARAVAAGGRVVAVFQPHLYSRTRLFAAEFGSALALADEVLVLDVYAAREDLDPGVSGALVAAAVPLDARRVAYLPERADVAGEVARRALPGDLVLTIGAGDVTDLVPSLLSALRAPGGAAG